MLLPGHWHATLGRGRRRQIHSSLKKSRSVLNSRLRSTVLAVHRVCGFSRFEARTAIGALHGNRTHGLPARVAALSRRTRIRCEERLCYGWDMRVAKCAVSLALGLTLSAGCTPKPERKKLTSADLVIASTGEVKAVVHAAQLEAKKEGRRLVVYVGASWCEPCEVFLDALREGALPPSLADLRVLKFDNDEDDQRLSASGYGGQMIPRFVAPRADGSASARRFEGSVKGPAAIANIVPRLEALFAEQ